MDLVFSIDVEEEGLFSGRYPREPETRNLACLERLSFVTKEFGVPLTLLTAYRVAEDKACQAALKTWRDERGAEIGAHLHPWSTPPFAALPQPEPIRSDALPLDLLQAKFETLLDSLRRNLDVAPRSFRMGRWDFGKQVESLLPGLGFQVDSSIAPLRHAPGGPDRFLTPYDPYWLPARSGATPILEVPLTQIPLLRGMPGLAHRLAQGLPAPWGESLLAKFSAVAAVGIQPVWHPLASMRWAARLHAARGGRVLCLFLHSSELMPGQSPHFPDQAAVDRLLGKIRSFLTWLFQRYPVQGTTLSGLRDRGFAEGAPYP